MMQTGNNLVQTKGQKVPHAGNTGFASGGVTPLGKRGKLCKLEDLYFYSSFMLVDSFVPPRLSDPKPTRTQSPKPLQASLNDRHA